MPGNPAKAAFKSAFTTAEGWGTFSRDSTAEGVNCKIQLKWGKLRVQTLALAPPEQARPSTVQVRVKGRLVASQYSQNGQRLLIKLENTAIINAWDSIEVRMS